MPFMRFPRGLDLLGFWALMLLTHLYMIFISAIFKLLLVITRAS